MPSLSRLTDLKPTTARAPASVEFVVDELMAPKAEHCVKRKHGSDRAAIRQESRHKIRQILLLNGRTIVVVQTYSGSEIGRDDSDDAARPHDTVALTQHHRSILIRHVLNHMLRKNIVERIIRKWKFLRRVHRYDARKHSDVGIEPANDQMLARTNMELPDRVAFHVLRYQAAINSQGSSLEAARNIDPGFHEPTDLRQPRSSQ